LNVLHPPLHLDQPQQNAALYFPVKLAILQQHKNIDRYQWDNNKPVAELARVLLSFKRPTLSAIHYRHYLVTCVIVGRTHSVRDSAETWICSRDVREFVFNIPIHSHPIPNFLTHSIGFPSGLFPSRLVPIPKQSHLRITLGLMNRKRNLNARYAPTRSRCRIH